MIATLVCAILFSILSVRCGSRSRPAREPESPPDTAFIARATCRLMLSNALRDPSSAEWISKDDWATIHNSDGTWSVLAHYRAKNGFGGMNVEKTTCVLRESTGTWTLVRTSRMQ